MVAVALGGSRAQGTERSDSDWDFGLYYQGRIDPEAIRALGYPGTVVGPGEWAYPMNGGAWLTVQGQKVDLLYRDVDDVRRWIEEAERGRWELYRVPGYLCGMPSYALVAELALCKVLVGSLPKPDFPEPLRETAPRRWRWEADFALRHAESPREPIWRRASASPRSPSSPKLHARLCERGEWITNEKSLSARAGLAGAESHLHAGPEANLMMMIASVRAAISKAQ